MKTKTLNFHQLNKRIKPIKSDWIIIILIILFFAGLIIGAYMIKNGENNFTSGIVESYSSFTDPSNSKSFTILFFKLFSIGSGIILLMYFTGLCALGIPFVSLIPFSAGLFIGIISGFYYKHYMLKGLGYCMIIIFPSMILFCASMLIACKGSIKMSRNMLNLLSMRHSQTQESFKSYTVNYLILILITALSCLVYTVLTKLFSGIFGF